MGRRVVVVVGRVVVGRVVVVGVVVVGVVVVVMGGLLFEMEMGTNFYKIFDLIGMKF